MSTHTSRILPRPRVTSALVEAMTAHPLVVLTAPMGYGKTTAAREAADSLTMPGQCRVMHVAVPPEAYGVSYLWRLIWTQLDEQGLEFAATVRELGFPADAEQRSRVFSYFRDMSGRILLVLDDFHFATDPAMHQFLDAMVREGLPNAGVLLLSRVRPELPLEEFRLKGMAAVFGQDFLAFTGDETAGLFRAFGGSRELADLAAPAAQELSAGWPAALWLILLNWLESGVVASARDAEAPLAESFFPSFDKGDRELLMRLSLLDGFTPEDAAVMDGTPEAADKVRGLYVKNAMLAYDQSTDRYHLHDIFRSFLIKRLEASPLDIPELRRRAAECSIARGDLIQAFRFLAKAGRDDDYLRLLELMAMPGGSLLLSYFRDEVAATMRTIPWRLRIQRHMEYLAFLYFYLAEAGDFHALSQLDEAEEHFAAEASFSDALKRRLHGEIVFIRSLLEFNNIQALCASFSKAHRLLQGRSQVVRPNMTWAFGCPNVSYLFLRDAGGYADMIKLIDDNLHKYQELTDGCGAGGQALFRAERLLERLEFDEVESLLGAAILQADLHEQPSTRMAARFALARLRMAQGDLDAAVDVMREQRREMEHLEHVNYANCLDLSLGYIHACLGERAAVPAWLRERELSPQRIVGPIAGFFCMVNARAVLLEGDYAYLEMLSKNLPASLGPFNNLFAHIHARLLNAVAVAHLRGRDAASQILREALELCRPDGIFLTPAEYGDELLPMLHLLRDAKPGDAYIQTLLAHCEYFAGALSERRRYLSDADRLSPREREMLQLAAKGHSNIAIARRLGVAPDTVKKILSSAYAKLKARNRADAVRLFQELNGRNRGR